MKESLSNKDTAFKTHTGGKKKYIYLALAGAACIIGMACYGFTYDGTDFDHDAVEEKRVLWTTYLTLSQLDLGAPTQSTTYSAKYAPDKVLSGRLSITGFGIGQWWKANFRGGDAYVVKVIIRNRKDCCGDRLGGTKVFIGTQLCGKIEMGTKQSQWYTVQCKKPLQGGTIKLETTQNTWLQINGIEVWGQSTRGSTGSTSPVGTSELVLEAPKQSTTHSTYTADKVLSGGLSITLDGVGQWWQANFKGGDAYVVQVRIRNRIDCCGDRLGGTKVFIGTRLCGKIQMGTKQSQWYTVQCKKPLQGGTIKLETTQHTYLQINGIEVTGYKQK